MRVPGVFLTAALLALGSGAAHGRAPVAAAQPWVSVRVVEGFDPAAPGMRLALLFQTLGHYSCAGYSIPTRLRVVGRSIDVRLGDARAPKGPCLTALGAATGSVTLPKLAPETFTLTLRHGAAVDRYRLQLSDEEIVLTPERATLSLPPVPDTLHRVPGGAVLLRCLPEPQCRTRTEAGVPTCETLYADPAIARLPVAARRPGPYAMALFDSDDHWYQPPDLEALVAHLRSRYSPPDPCLRWYLYRRDGPQIGNTR